MDVIERARCWVLTTQRRETVSIVNETNQSYASFGIKPRLVNLRGACTFVSPRDFVARTTTI